MLKVTLFGTPKIVLDDQSFSELITGRRLALLIYLVASGRPHMRDVLADLLWSNTSNRKARKHLRDALPTLRKYLSPYLMSSADTITFNHDSYYWLDVEVFRSYMNSDLTKCNQDILKQVLDLYQDDFLGGFYVHRAPVFEEWVLQEREELQKLMVRGLHYLANHHLAQKNEVEGLLITKRLLTLEPWNEEAHRLRMKFLAKSGQRSAALEQYATCHEVLQKEYGVEPLPETINLYLDIKSGDFVRPHSEPHRLNLNASFTKQNGDKLKEAINSGAIPHSAALYGRKEELAQLNQWIQQNQSRLITVFGMAGQGKSALIANLVHDRISLDKDQADQIERFDYVLWYSLISQPTVEQLICLILTRLLPSGRELPNSLVEQLTLLIDCLHRQRCLLILDDVEQVIPNDEAQMTANYSKYQEFWRSVAQNKHQSCLILASRIYPQELNRLERNNNMVHALLLRGLSTKATFAILGNHQLSANEAWLTKLVDSYSGHPQALILIQEMMEELSTDEIEFFFEDGIIFDELRNLLAFDTLLPAERDLLIWLAILDQPHDLKSLWSNFVQPHPKLSYLSAQRTLRRRAVLTELPTTSRMALPKIVQTYVIDYLVETITQEIIHYQTKREALGLEWLDHALSVSGATTIANDEEINLSLLRKINPNDLEKWLVQQGRGLTYLNRYRLSFPLHEAIISRLTAKWGKQSCAKQLEDVLSKQNTHLIEEGYAQTNLHNLLLFFPKKKNSFPSSYPSRAISPLAKGRDIVNRLVLEDSRI